MNFKLPFNWWYEKYLGLLLLLILVAPKLITIGLILFIPLVIIGMMKRKMYFRLHPVSALFLVLYLFYLGYCAITRHPDIATRYLEYKLSFLLFPLIVSFIPKQKLSMQLPVVGFLIGTFYLLIYGFVHSYTCYTSGNTGFGCFLTVNFSSIHHPSYTSAYYVVALFLVWYAWYMRYVWMKIWVALPLSLLLVVATGLCLSLAGMLYLMLAVMFTALVLVYKKWGKRGVIPLVIILPVMAYLSIQYVPQIRGEWQGATNFADEFADDPEAFIRSKHYPMSGSEVRLVMWYASSQVLNDHPLGVGTGNVDEVLTYRLNKLGQQELAKMEYNPHNQYLQTGIEIGWAGMVLLIAILLIALRIGWKFRNWLLILVATNLLFNMLFESMLQRQSGIMFYTFGICLLCVISSSRILPSKEPAVRAA